MQGLAVLFAIIAFFAGVGIVRAKHITIFAAVVDAVYFSLLLSAFIWFMR